MKAVASLMAWPAAQKNFSIFEIGWHRHLSKHRTGFYRGWHSYHPRKLVKKIADGASSSGSVSADLFVPFQLRRPSEQAFPFENDAVSVFRTQFSEGFL